MKIILNWIELNHSHYCVETQPVIVARTNKQWTTYCAALYWSRNAHLMTWQATMRMQRNVFRSGWNTRDHVLWTRDEEDSLYFFFFLPLDKPHNPMLNSGAMVTTSLIQVIVYQDFTKINMSLMASRVWKERKWDELAPVECMQYAPHLWLHFTRIGQSAIVWDEVSHVR